jgi:demethylmenaquinone methyltransferase/2-methoxy-6-polyprenyl-1,4-benzoquinol methylase
VSSADTERLGSGAMFDAIAARYDAVNRVISLGLDQGWRRRAVAALALPASGRALDLATGTGDLAIAIQRAHAGAQVVGVDPSEQMLAVGREKIASAGLPIELRVGDAQSLDFADDAFDGVTIAFGIRNVEDRPRALREMARVTRRGGRVVVLELSEPRQRLLGRLTRFYVHEVVPRVGGALSGAREYAYLQRSIAAFPPAAEFSEIMRGAGLDVLEAAPLTFGVATLFVATPSKGARA